MANEEWIDPIFDAVVSDVQRCGYLDKVNQHEPKRKPKTGVTAGIWVQSMEPVGNISGLNSSCARLVFMVRLYHNLDKTTPDLIDPNMAKATSDIMRRYHDDFDFEGTIRNVDLFGIAGIKLAALAGYLDIDGAFYRVMDITVPCLVNDVWPQVKRS